MIKRIVIYVLGSLLCLMQMGCLDDSYTGTVFVKDYIDNTIPHEVRITIGGSNELSIFNKYSTKGSGVIEDLSKFSGRDFYVYAFNQDILTDYSVRNEDDSLRCLIDGSFDIPGSLAGRKASFDNYTENVDWVDSDVPIYYPMYENEGHIYDFFAYYIDDIQLTNEQIHRNSYSVTLDIEIDGSQDIMSAKAMPTEKQLASIKDERERLYQEKHSYSYYTASRNLHPNFEFYHQLVKLDFKLIPGGTPGTTKDVTVHKIEVESRYKGSFNVADKYDASNMGITFSNEKTRFTLAEKDGSEFIPRVISTVNKHGVSTVGVIEDMGSFLVAPDREYFLHVYLSEEQPDFTLPIKENELHIFQGTDKSNPIPFVAGQKYLITLTVYGQMDIRVAAELGDWGDGGDAEYNPDEELRPGKNQKQTIFTTIY